jgi:decaprenyl-phosphate phosphoribosyltransferase
VPPSGWFLAVCSLGAFGVAIAKRYTELAGLGPAAIAHRPALRWYRPWALLTAQWIVAAAMVAAYVAWAAGERTDAITWHLVSAIPLTAALVRFGVLTARHTTAPVEDLLIRDGLMLTCELTWLALFVTGLQA